MLFQNLSFALDPGDVLHVAGPNGSGKTSLLRLMAGALAPAAGQLRWQGEKLGEKPGEKMSDPAAHARRLAFLPAGEQGLKMQDTAHENLAFWAAVLGAEETAPGHALARMDLEKQKNTPVRRLSSGQRRRLALCRVLLRPAPLWLLDEPLNALDIRSHDLFAAALDTHCAAGGLAVIASHYAVDPPRKGRLARLELEGT